MVRDRNPGDRGWRAIALRVEMLMIGTMMMAAIGAGVVSLWRAL